MNRIDKQIIFSRGEQGYSSRECDQELRSIRWAARRETLGSILSLFLVAALSVLLVATARQYEKRELELSDQMAALNVNLKDLQKEGGNAAVEGAQLAVEAKPNPEAADADLIGVQLRDTQRAIKAAKEELEAANKRLKEANIAIADTEANFQGVRNYVANVKILEDRFKQKASMTEKTLRAELAKSREELKTAKELQEQKNEAERVAREKEKAIKGLEAKLWVAELDSMVYQSQLASAHGVNKQLETTLQQLKNRPEPRPRAVLPSRKPEVNLREEFAKYRSPDPDLATLVIVVDAQTNFSFLQRELIDFYTYHNCRKGAKEFVIVDLARGGSLARTPLSLPVSEKLLSKVDIRKLVDGLDFHRHTTVAPEPNGIPKELQRDFRGPSNGWKNHQIILIAGRECNAPSPASWPTFLDSVHVCLIDDAPAVLSESFTEAWKSFCKNKGGEFVTLKVDLGSPASQALVRGEVKTWLEERLRPVPSSVTQVGQNSLNPLSR